jgi:dsRNA-specific ribonuclease
MISHSKENDPSLQNIKKEYKKKLKEFQKSNEESPPKWAFGTLDKLSNSPETLVELYEADTLKMREGFGAGGKIGEIAGGLKERCRIL